MKTKTYKVYPLRYIRGFVATFVSTMEQAEQQKKYWEELTWVEWAIAEVKR